MIEDEELVGALLAGAKLELQIFDIYDWLIPSIKGSAARREVAKIRLQELKHGEIVLKQLQKVLPTPTVYESSFAGVETPQTKLLSPIATVKDVRNLPLPAALKTCYTIDRHYENAYYKLVSMLRDPLMKSELLFISKESMQHAKTIASILKGMGEEVKE